MKKKQPKITTTQERILADSVAVALEPRYSRFREIDLNKIPLRSRIASEKRLIELGCVKPGSKLYLTSKGVDIGVKDYKERTDKNLIEDYKNNKAEAEAENKLDSEIDSNFKRLFKGIKIYTGSSKISVETFLRKYGRLEKTHLIEIAEQLKK